MPKVSVSQEIEGKRQDIYHAVKKYLDEKNILSKFGGDIDWDEKSCSGEISSSSFKGAIQVHEKKGKSVVEISIDLPLLLTPIKGKVEEELKKHLGRLRV